MEASRCPEGGFSPCVLNPAVTLSPTLLGAKIIFACPPSFASARVQMPAVPTVGGEWGNQGSLRKLPLGVGRQAEATGGDQSLGIQVCPDFPE